MAKRRLNKALGVQPSYGKNSVDELPKPANIPLNLTPRGTPGLRHAGGYVVEEFLRKLNGRNGIQQYREIHYNSVQVGAILYFLEALIRRIEWGFTPNPASKNEKLAKENADFMTECMNDMEHTWHKFIEEALTYLMYGWATFEKVYKIRRGPMNIPELKSKYKDGRIGWRKMELRSQDTMLRWEIERETGEVKGLWQQDPWTGKASVYIANEYLVHFKHHQHKGNPEGRSLFRNSVIPYLRLKRMEEIEAIGVERDMCGLLVMEVPPSVLNSESAQDRASLLEIEGLLGGLKADERAFAIIPSELNGEGKPTGYKLRLMSSGGSKQLDIVRIKESYKTDIFQSALVQFLMLGQGDKGGSYSLASSSTSLATMAVGAIRDNIVETIQKEAVEHLAILNRMEPEDTPLLKAGDIEKAELEAITSFVSMLHTTGNMQPSDQLVEHLHKLGDLPYDPTGGPAPNSPEAAKLAADLAQKPGDEGPPKPGEKKPAFGKPPDDEDDGVETEEDDEGEAE